jgi:hypothetical protein
LVEIAENSQILFEFLVYLFGLSIGLGVICSGGIHNDVMSGVEFLHEVQGKVQATVANDLSWFAV